MRPHVDLHGKQFGRWTVLGIGGGGDGVLWRCRCVCGTERLIRSNSLRWGHTKSCGCSRKGHFPGAESVPVGPLVVAFKRSGLSASEVAKRAGHTRWKNGTLRGDDSWTARRLGLRPQSKAPFQKATGLVSVGVAERLCWAMDLDPVDFGI